MFNCKTQVINQNKFVTICRGEKWAQTIQGKCHLYYNRANQFSFNLSLLSHCSFPNSMSVLSYYCKLVGNYKLCIVCQSAKRMHSNLRKSNQMTEKKSVLAFPTLYYIMHHADKSHKIACQSDYCDWLSWSDFILSHINCMRLSKTGHLSI